MRGKRENLATELSEEVESGLIDSHVAAAALSRRTRLREQWRFVRSGQFEQLRHRRRLYASVADLATLKARTRAADGDWEPVQRTRREVATLSTVEPRPVHLPAPSSPLVGRERESEDVAQLLTGKDCRLVTLTGSGGAGKTRLATHVAAQVADHFGSGVYMVELAPITDEPIAVSEIARTLGVRQVGGDALEGVTYHLRDKHVLLVLDNLEQLAEGGRLVATLLQDARGLRVLATSRNPLHVSGEHQYEVPPLRLPEPDATNDPQALAQCESVALFLDRARAIDPEFRLDEENATAVADICARLDGLPLAIELAASRTRLLTPQAISAKLRSSLDLLTSGSADRPARHQTLRAALDWGYDLLDEEGRVLLQELAVFAGGCTLESAEEVCSVSEGTVLDGLESLVDMSLLRRAGSTEPVRYVMLGTVREYATERLGDHPDRDSVARRHAEHYLSFAAEAATMLEGPEQAAWARRVDDELENVRAALAWALSHGCEDLAMRMAAALRRFWERGPLGEGRRWLERALAAPGQETGADVWRAEALRTAGRLASLQGDYADGKRLLEEARERFTLQRDDRAGQTAVVAELAWITLVQGDYERSAELWEEALSLSREAGNQLGMARALTGLARGLAEQGHHTRAGALAREGLDLRRELGDARDVANSLTALGRIEVLAGHNDEARRLLDESLALSRDLGDQLRQAEALYFLSLAGLQEGSTEESVTLLRDRLELCRALGDRLGIAECLDAIGGVAAMRQEGRRAARLFGAADGVRASIGAAPWRLERSRRERDEAAARTNFERVTFESEKAQARGMGLDEAVQLGQETAAHLTRART